MNWQPIDNAPKDRPILVCERRLTWIKGKKAPVLVPTGRWRIGIVKWDGYAWVATDCCDGHTSYDDIEAWVEVPDGPYKIERHPDAGPENPR